MRDKLLSISQETKMTNWKHHNYITREEWGTLVQYKKFIEEMDTPHKKMMWESIKNKYPSLFGRED